MKTGSLEEQRSAAHRKLAPELLLLYASPEAGSKYHNVFKTHHLPEKIYTSYVNAIGDVILGFYKTTELPQKLAAIEGIDETTAATIANELAEFLQPVVQAEQEGRVAPVGDTPGVTAQVAEVQTQQIPIKTAVPSATPAPTTPNTAAIPAVNTEAAEDTEPGEITSVKPLRTMADDMKVAHGYGAQAAASAEEEDETPTYSSNQEALLKQEQSTPLPPYGSKAKE